MSLLDVLRTGVKIADKITKPLQATVRYQRESSKDEYGKVTPKPVIPLRAIVDYGQKKVRTQTGEIVNSRATVTLLDVAAVQAATGGAGIGPNDTFTLPDNTVCPVLDVTGFMDAGTGKPEIGMTVMLG